MMVVSLLLAEEHATTRCSSPTTPTSTSIDALYRVPGVGEVRIFGAGDYAMRIWVKPDRLATLGLTVPDLVARDPAAEHRQPVGPGRRASRRRRARR